MSTFGKLLSFTRKIKNKIKGNDARIALGGGHNITTDHMGAIGDDNHPLVGDYVVVVDIPRSGGAVTVAYLDPKNKQLAEKGERRLYSRDEAGDQVAQLWLKNDGSFVLENDEGSVEMDENGETTITQGQTKFTVAPDQSITGENAAGSFALQSDGSFLVNGLMIDVAGNLTTTGDVTAGTTTLKTHVHSGVTSGPSNTGPPV